jgi:hypothetical protein
VTGAGELRARISEADDEQAAVLPKNAQGSGAFAGGLTAL